MILRKKDSLQRGESIFIITGCDTSSTTTASTESTTIPVTFILCSGGSSGNDIGKKIAVFVKTFISSSSILRRDVEVK